MNIILIWLKNFTAKKCYSILSGSQPRQWYVKTTFRRPNLSPPSGSTWGVTNILCELWSLLTSTPTVKTGLVSETLVFNLILKRVITGQNFIVILICCCCSKMFELSYVSKQTITYLHTVLWIYYTFCWRDMHMYLVLSGFNSTQLALPTVYLKEP